MHPLKQKIKDSLEEAYKRGQRDTLSKPVEQDGWRVSVNEWRCVTCQQVIKPGDKHATEKNYHPDFVLCLTRHPNGTETGFKTERLVPTWNPEPQYITTEPLCLTDTFAGKNINNTVA